ncbi:MAG TPA: heparan-alpha-glucosaminide N-acetyltransferase domain-containing protein [Polyangiales bacterium]|nr:heparan-alpha-glucosaminide N-acetyltransferase domain-containing protein [Polyangiales bacterium]
MSSESRVVFVDLLRFAAAVQMLQGHTIAALLAPEHRHGAGFALWSAARGLTSVAFLFAAGLSFYLATERARDPQAPRRRVRRALRLIALGYLLHLPVVALVSDDPSLRLRALHEFAAVDVLQCIGVCLLVLEALRPLARPVQLCAAVGGACLVLAPLAAALPVQGALRPLAAYLGPRGGSLFPLSPWAAHVFFGFACGYLVRAPLPGSVGVRLCAVGVAGLAIAVAASWLGAPGVIRDHLLRLSEVVLVSAGLAWLATHTGRPPRWLMDLASNTLLLYVFHVLLVYGSGVGLGSWIGPTLGPVQAVLAALAVIVLSCAVALGYERLARARGTG